MIVPIKQIILESLREDFSETFIRRANNLPRKPINNNLAIGTGIIGGAAVGGTLAGLTNEDPVDGPDGYENTPGDNFKTAAGMYGGAILGAGLGANDWVKNKFQENKIQANIQSRINKAQEQNTPKIKENFPEIRPEHLKDLGINVYNNIKTGVGNKIISGKNIYKQIKKKIRY